MKKPTQSKKVSVSSVLRANLQHARNRLYDGWIQGAFAVDANGEAIAANSPDAVAWSLVGAMLSVLPTKKYNKKIAEITRNPDVASLVAWNDAPGRTLEEVVELIDIAMAVMRRRRSVP